MPSTSFVIPTTKSRMKIWPRTYSIHVRGHRQRLIDTCNTLIQNLKMRHEFLQAFSSYLKLKSLSPLQNNYILSLKN